MSVELDRLYDLIAQRTGITRNRDLRLEALAADRALEARFTVGLDCVAPCEIPHPVEQLKARTFLLQGTFKGVWENAFWTYKIEDQDDPYQAALEAWWASPVHKDNLLRDEATTHGLGVYSEAKPGSPNRRYYFVHEFTKDLLTDATALKTTFRAGTYNAYHFHADGSVAQSTTFTFSREAIGATDGSAVINKQLYVHMTGGKTAGWWIHPVRYLA